MADAPADAEQFNDGVAIVVAEADGDVCERCRMTRETVGSDPDIRTSVTAVPRLFAQSSQKQWVSRLMKSN